MHYVKLKMYIISLMCGAQLHKETLFITERQGKKETSDEMLILLYCNRGTVNSTMEIYSIENQNLDA